MTILAVLGHHFGTILQSSGSQMHWEGPWRVDFQWFLMDFGSPFGDHFGSLFDIFCSLKRQKACLDCRRDYCWLLIWTYTDFWRPNLSSYIVNIDVFIRFDFVDFFMNLMISGAYLDFILNTFGGLGRPIWWFLGYWRLLEILMNFRVSPEPPQVETMSLVGGTLSIQGVQ